jgi:hypothetical protein
MCVRCPIVPLSEGGWAKRGESEARGPSQNVTTLKFTELFDAENVSASKSGSRNERAVAVLGNEKSFV